MPISNVASPTNVIVQEVAAVASDGRRALTSGTSALEPQWSPALEHVVRTLVTGATSALDPGPRGREVDMHLMAAAMGETYAALVRDRNELVRIRFERGELNRAQKQRLAMLRWKLDRIDEARMARDLDRMDAMLAAQEKLSANVQSFVRAVKTVSPTVTRARRRRR